MYVQYDVSTVFILYTVIIHFTVSLIKRDIMFNISMYSNIYWYNITQLS